MTDEELNQVVERCVERLLLVLPGVINRLVRTATSLHELSEQFYRDNGDLVEHKPLVAKVLEGLESQHAGRPMSELLPLAASEARKQLKVQHGLSRVSAYPTREQVDANLGVL